jgi:hypothetical protein
MTIEEQIKEFLKSGDYRGCRHLLIDNTGKDKPINPKDVDTMEGYYSLLFNYLNKKGEYRGLCSSVFALLEHLKRLEQTDEQHYHKGLEYHNMGIALYRLSLRNFLLAFIEDAIRKQDKFPLTPARQYLEGLFKVEKGDLQKLGHHAIEILNKKLELSENILDNFTGSNGYLHVELWQVENNISQIEKEIRECINKTLGQNWIDNKLYIPGNKKKEIERRQMREKGYLGKASSDSLIDYLSFPDYIDVVDNPESELKFKPIFDDIDEFKRNMQILELIRNKIAHFRDIYITDIEEVNRIRKWLGPKLEKGLTISIEEIPSQHWDSSAFGTSGQVINVCIMYNGNRYIRVY